MKKSIAIAGMILAFLLVSGFHFRAQGNEIYGCYQKENGQLRIVSKSSACRSSEIAISWNKVGPQGPAGPEGPQGPVGPAGSNAVAPQAKTEPGPRVYDANGQFLGILPSDLYGALSIYIPTLSKFIFLSSDNGEVDPFFPAVYLYFDGENCTGNAYVDTGLPYQILKVGSYFNKADDVAAGCKEIKSLSAPEWTGGRQCRSYSAACIPVLPYKEVTLSFILPAALPLYLEY
jgi:hypothetical protein